MSNVRHVSHLYLIALMLVVLCEGLSGDQLLFHSDVFSFVYVTCSLALFVFLAFLSMGALLLLASRHRASRVLQALPRVTLTVLLTSLLTFTVEAVASETQTIFRLAVIMTLTAGLSTYLVSKSPDLPHVLTRLSTIAQLATIAGLVIVPSGFAYTRLADGSAAGTSSKPARHAILVVIDGMPSQLLRTYQPAAEETEFDRIAGRGLVLLNARTNKVYTSGYFGVLYSGRTDLALGGREGTPDKNLLDMLQTQGIATRWISFHPNGIPESNSITDYQGD